MKNSQLAFQYIQFITFIMSKFIHLVESFDIVNLLHRVLSYHLKYARNKYEKTALHTIYFSTYRNHTRPQTQKMREQLLLNQLPFHEKPFQKLIPSIRGTSPSASTAILLFDGYPTKAIKNFFLLSH